MRNMSEKQTYPWDELDEQKPVDSAEHGLEAFTDT